MVRAQTRNLLHREEREPQPDAVPDPPRLREGHPVDGVRGPRGVVHVRVREPRQEHLRHERGCGLQRVADEEERARGPPLHEEGAVHGLHERGVVLGLPVRVRLERLWLAVEAAALLLRGGFGVRALRLLLVVDVGIG